MSHEWPTNRTHVIAIANVHVLDLHLRSIADGIEECDLLLLRLLLCHWRESDATDNGVQATTTTVLTMKVFHTKQLPFHLVTIDLHFATQHTSNGEI